jgi:hypothetical protein
MRKCPTAHQMLGCNSMWELSTSQFRWIIENIVEEIKPVDKKNGGKHV